MTALVYKIAKTQARDALRSRWIAVYTLFFLLATEGLMRFSGDGAKAVLSLSSATLIVVPLVTLVLSTIYVYNAREFTELLLAQPIRRSTLFNGLYLGLAVPMAAGFVAGIGLPMLLRGGGDPAQRGTIIALLVVGVLLTFVSRRSPSPSRSARMTGCVGSAPRWDSGSSWRCYTTASCSRSSRCSPTIRSSAPSSD